MKTTNKFVAVTPFKKENTENQPRARGLDMTDATITRLIQAEVLFDSDSFNKGDVLFFRSDILRMPQSNQKLTLDGVTFILMAEEWPVLVQRKNDSYSRPAPLPVSSNGQ